MRSWTDGLDDKWNAYDVFNTKTNELIAVFFREDLAFECCKMLNDKMGVPAYWFPNMATGLCDNEMG